MGATREPGRTAALAGSLVSATTIVHADLFDHAGRRLGRVDDIVVRLAQGFHPPVTGLRVRSEGRHVFAPIGRVDGLQPYRISLHAGTPALGEFERRPGEVLLDQDVLGRRLINVATGRLMHANDLAIGQSAGQWRLIGVDSRTTIGIHRLLPWRSRSGVIDPAGIVDWANIEAFTGHVPTALLPLGLRRLRRLHPAQIADLVEHVSHEEGEQIISAVGRDADLQAEVFEELNPEHQREFLEQRSDTEAAAVLAEMPDDAAADLVTELPQERRGRILALLPRERQTKVRQLLAYHPDTAGGLMGTEAVIVKRNATVAEALEAVRAVPELSPEAGAVIVLVDDENHHVGTVALSDVVRAAPDSTVDDAGTVVTARLSPTSDLPDVGLLLTDYNLAALPVVDPDGTVLGVVTVDDLLEAMVPDDWRRRRHGDTDD